MVHVVDGEGMSAGCSIARYDCEETTFQALVGRQRGLRVFVRAAERRRPGGWNGRVAYLSALR